MKQGSDQSGSPDLNTFLGTLGQSLKSAQADFTGSEFPVQPGILLAEAEVEVRSVIQQDDDGQFRVHTLSPADVRAGKVEAGALSTLKMRFVATAPEADSNARSAASEATKESITAEIRKRPDIKSLEKAVGPLDINLEYAPLSGRWLSTIKDEQGRIVRELILPDVRTK